MPVPIARATRSKRRFGFAWPNPLTAGALAVVLLAAGLGIGSLLRGGPDSSCTTRAAKVDAAAGAGARGELEVCDGSATLALTGMQAPPQGRIYELWLDDPNDRQGPKPARAVLRARRPRLGRGRQASARHARSS